MTSTLRDRLGRPLVSLRLSVTDRCNLRCAYCMPEEDYAWLPREDLLTFEELAALARVFAGLGVRRLRLTGGEPLLRRDLPALVALLRATPGLEDLALTTNGVRLAEQAAALRAAGLGRVTVSLDTLRPATFRRLTRRDDHAHVLEGIRAVAGWPGLKLDTVLLRGTNDDELLDLVAFAREVGAEVRFIEYMDVGGATRWSLDQVVPRAEVLARLGDALGPVEAISGPDDPAPAERFRLGDGTTVGVIASTTAPFCARCDRSRLTADGLWLLCLYATTGTDLRALLRAGAGPEALRAAITAAWTARADRGAEERLALAEQRRLLPLATAGALREDPHLEMHTRGG